MLKPVYQFGLNNMQIKVCRKFGQFSCTAVNNVQMFVSAHFTCKTVKYCKTAELVLASICLLVNFGILAVILTNLSFK